MTDILRIFRVEVKTRRGRKRVHQRYVKVPYGGAFAMTEMLTRMVTIGQIERFTIAAATPDEIAVFRPYLRRWLEAITTIEGVSWQA